MRGNNYLTLLAFVLAVSMLMTGAKAEFCYQESATVQNQSGTDGNCELQYTGSYSCEGAWNEVFTCTNVYDGNWGTLGFGDFPDVQLLINYTKPAGATNGSLWQVMDGGYDPNKINYTIPYACLSQDNLQLKLLSSRLAVYGVGMCYDGYDWIEIFNNTEETEAPLHPEYIFEDGIWWDIATEISDCAVLDQTGQTYLMTANITNSTTATCMNITANNVILDCQGHTIDGITPVSWADVNGIYSVGYGDITVKNCIITDWVNGIHLKNSQYNTLTNLTVSGSTYDGIYLESSSNNILTNLAVSGSTYNGIYLYSSSNNTLTNLAVSDNTYNGIHLYSSSNNTLSNNIISDSGNAYGIFLEESVPNGAYSWDNTFYNNLLNNTWNTSAHYWGYQGLNNVNVGFCNWDIDWAACQDWEGANYFNTTQQAGTRIYSTGTDIGGNYWTNSTSNGYSDTCTDSNADGFCDSPYTLAENNIDYLALSDEYAPPTTIEISDCAELNETGMTYLLTAHIIDSNIDVCMDIQADNITLDCQGHRIDGQDVSNTLGISINRISSTISNVTIKNCIVTDWYRGIRTWFANNNTLINNTANSNTFNGFAIRSSNNNTLINNIAYDNAQYGIYPNIDSNDNIFINNTVYNNVYGFRIAQSNRNVFTNNTAIGNVYGVRVGGSSNNTFYNNIFNNTVNFLFDDTNKNYWNTTKQAGTRIYSDGDQIGGNYWTNSTSNGYSDTCTDSNTDGFCDEPYVLAENNTDYLALSDEYFPPTTIEISDCLVLDQAGATYLLTADIADSSASTCMDITANSVILDCQGHTIDGIGSNYGVHIGRGSATNTNITVENCILTDWYYAIWLSSSSNNTLYNIDASGNNIGIFLQSSSNNILSTIIANSNANYGIWLESSSNNILSDIIASGNNFGIYLEYICNYNILTNLTVSGNDRGIYLYYNSNDNILTNLTISGNVHGIFLESAANNLIYNSLFNNSVNMYSGWWEQHNDWNTTRQAGTRIYSAGTEIGGNYWTNSAGNGYSDTCADSDYDGFCDESYVLAENNVDYLALSNQYGATYITATFDYNTVHFGNLAAGSSDTRGGFDVGFYLSVSVDTNAAYKIEASGTNFTDGGEYNFYIGNLKMGMNETAVQLDLADSTALSESPQVIETDIPSTTTVNFHGFWLSIPAAQYAGAYTSTVTITYSNV